MEVECFVEEIIFVGYEIVVLVLVLGGELYLGAGNSAVAIELEEAHAVLYYVGWLLGLGSNGSHCDVKMILFPEFACVFNNCGSGGVVIYISE